MFNVTTKHARYRNEQWRKRRGGFYDTYATTCEKSSALKDKTWWNACMKLHARSWLKKSSYFAVINHFPLSKRECKFTLLPFSMILIDHHDARCVLLHVIKNYILWQFMFWEIFSSILFWKEKSNHIGSFTYKLIFTYYLYDLWSE